MNISTIKRSGQKPYKQGNRYNPDPFYQTSEWKKARKLCLISNPYCVECLKEGNKVKATAVDHKTRIKDGGSRTDQKNLQGLCDHHHAVKSAREVNESRK